MFNNIYENKKIFLTGHTGFKGAWLYLWLTNLGAEVFGYSLKPDTEPSLYNILGLKNGIYADILNVETLEKSMNSFKPDIVFHLAAQPLVRDSYLKPVLTYQTNVIGSLNVLEAARKCDSVKAFVNITTDKCYENKEINKGYKEDDQLGGFDMYSSSKACVEILSSSYRRSFLQEPNSFLLATARAGNVIGGGDWASDRLIPDCIRAIIENKPVEIRNPIAIRPWQHVLEPLFGYLLLGEKLLTENEIFAQSFNFGPSEDSVLTVSEVAKKVCDFYGQGQVIIGEKSPLHEAGLLTLNIEKANELLDWKPTYNADIAIEKTVKWYKSFYDNQINMLDYTLSQIKDFESKVNNLK